jgi:hypothetical protein
MVKVKPHLQVYHLIVAKKCVSPGGPTRSMSFIDESAKLINSPTNKSFNKFYLNEEKKKERPPTRQATSPARPNLREKHTPRPLPAQPALQKSPIRILAGVENILRVIEREQDGGLRVGRDAGQDAGVPRLGGRRCETAVSVLWHFRVRVRARGRGGGGGEAGVPFIVEGVWRGGVSQRVRAKEGPGGSFGYAEEGRRTGSGRQSKTA